jgi:DNA-binding response OmpR family regulator
VEHARDNGIRAPVKPRALLVEDDGGFAEMLAALVRRLGFEVSHAGTIAEGRGLLAQERFDVLILDFQLPDGDARDLLAEMEKGEGDLPVFVISADREAERAMRGLSLRAQFKKPLDTRGFKQALLETWRAEEQPSPQPG